MRRADFAAFEWSVNELTDNVLVHSEPRIGGIVQVSTFHKMSKRVQFVVEPEIMTWNLALAAHQQITRQGFVKAVGLAFIDPSQIGARHSIAAQMVEPMSLG